MMLLAGVPRANLVALVAWERDDGGDRMRILHWERRLGLGGDFRPSRKLVGTAIEHGSSVVHVWNAERAGESTYTMSDNVDWAFCTPIVGEACAGWGVYVAGRSEADRSPGFAQSGNGDSTITSTGPIDLRGDLKFTELVASTVGALRGVQALQRRQATLSQFFAPAVFRAMGTDRSEAVLQPRETEVTVLFCDLRGFSRHSERSADKLLPLLERVSQALGVMTHQILDHGGVLGDFQGDAAMGFWGWPLAQPDKVPRACQAALTICNQFQSASQDAEHSLAGFRVGIGMATGRAVAGRIGTEDQVKVTVFGPVVNLASRLEGMTKRCRAAILIDGATAERVRREVSPDIARLRRVARVRPYGMDAVVDVHELLPPAEWPEALSDLALQRYGEALLQFEAGHLHEALSLLDGQLQADPVANFLAAAINELGSTLPTDFDGVIRLTSKE
jgi:adenylate cyclase